ncbi:MAG: diguanylate cyclase [Nitrospirae bacterium]|nr:diguanylate cyclase [Nitrospirota bacterium]
MLNILLKDIAQKENLSVQGSATLKILVDLMNINQKGVVVILEDLKPIGILTERDVVEILFKGISLDEEIYKYAKKNLVSTIGVRTVGYALNLTLENNIRRVIVVDDSNNFIGVVTQQDLLKYLEEDFYRLTIKVKHIVKNTGDLLYVSPGEPLNNVLKIMFANKISSVPVLEDGRPIGIISEKDILKLAGKNTLLDSSVSKYMNSPVDTARLDSLLVEVVEVMNYKNIRRVVIVDDEGSAIKIITIRDVIENLEGNYNKFLERKLQSAKEILNLLPEMLIEVTDTGREQLIIWVNDKVVSRFGREILDKPVTSFFPPDTWSNIYSSLIKLGKIEHIKLKKDDSIYELSGFFITTFGKMEKGRFQLIMRDITEDIKLSTVDPLTDIYNRRFINAFLMKEIERSKRLDRHFSVVISDIDNFKIINDSYGHLSGDIVLKALARLITDTVRNLDVVGRYGGDEFMLILPDTNNETANNIIDRIRVAVENLEMPVLRDINVRITASFGIAAFPEDGTSLEDLLVSADERLYKAKRLGKNKIAFK